MRATPVVLSLHYRNGRHEFIRCRMFSVYPHAGHTEIGAILCLHFARRPMRTIPLADVETFCNVSAGLLTADERRAVVTA